MNVIGIAIWAVIVLFEFNRKKESLKTALVVGFVAALTALSWSLYDSGMLFNLASLDIATQASIPVVLVLSALLYAAFDVVIQKLVNKYSNDTMPLLATTALTLAVVLVLSAVIRGVQLNQALLIEIATVLAVVVVAVMGISYLRLWEMLASKVSFLQ
jgi:hypothetical protein